MDLLIFHLIRTIVAVSLLQLSHQGVILRHAHKELGEYDMHSYDLETPFCNLMKLILQLHMHLISLYLVTAHPIRRF